MTDHANELRKDKRPQSSTVVHALLDRLEAAEAEALEEARLNGMGSEREAALMAKLEAAERERDECNRRRLEAADHFAAQTALMKKKCDALRARIEAMVRQEPVAWARKLGLDVPSFGCVTDLKYRPSNIPESSHIPLYALPGAQTQPAPSVPSEQDESVRKAWSRFSNELHRSPDAPYPGMSEAFEQHFSQSFIDREWRSEAATWAAAWKAAKRHCAQPAPSVLDAIIKAAMEAQREGCAEVVLQAAHKAAGYNNLRDYELLRELSIAVAKAPEAKP